MTRFHPLPFYFVVASNAINGQVSQALTGDLAVAEATMIFPAGTMLNLLYQFFWLGRPPTNLAVLPAVPEMTVKEITRGVYVGDAIAYSIPFQYQIPDMTKYLGMFATNNTATQLSAQAVIILEAAD